MKIKSFAILPALLGLAFNVFSQDIIEVPLTLGSGYSLFTPAMVNVSPEPEHSPYRFDLTGIPENLQNVTRHQYVADEKQFLHQNYVSGKLTKERYDQMMEFWKYDLRKDQLSDDPINCFVYIIVGEDEEGNKVWLADTNLDLDFSDEVPRPLFQYPQSHTFEKYKEIADNAVQLKYQRIVDNQLVEEEFSFAAALMDNGNLLFNYPKHYKATFEVGHKVYNVVIQSQYFLSRYLQEAENSMMVLTDGEIQDSVENAPPVLPNQFFHLGEDVYQYLGVDAEQQTVKIRSVKNMDTSQSAQVGYISPDFQGADFKSGAVVAMEQFRGKYVLLDFWATWCGPCIREFPRLKELTTQYDESKFEIVGIIGASKPENVEKLIDKYELTWNQILSDEIVEKFGVVSYPTTFLISPEGVIIHKDLREEALEEHLAELFKE